MQGHVVLAHAQGNQYVQIVFSHRACVQIYWKKMDYMERGRHRENKKENVMLMDCLHG